LAAATASFEGASSLAPLEVPLRDSVLGEAIF
jgi:hypothetical protein